MLQCSHGNLSFFIIDISVCLRQEARGMNNNLAKWHTAFRFFHQRSIKNKNNNCQIWKIFGTSRPMELMQMFYKCFCCCACSFKSFSVTLGCFSSETLNPKPSCCFFYPLLLLSTEIINMHFYHFCCAFIGQCFNIKYKSMCTRIFGVTNSCTGSAESMLIIKK